MRHPAIGAALFALVGPGLEAGVAPLLLTGWRVGGGLPGAWPLRALGLAAIAAGLAVLADTYRRFVRDGRGTPTPAAPTTELVVAGAYRWVRHPMYVATATVILGEGLLLRRAILLVAGAAYALALGTLARAWEEPRLHARFGGEWEAYRAAVPAFLPRGRRALR